MDGQTRTPNHSDATSTIREDSLLVNIWRKPTATLQFILANCPDKHVTALLVLGGAARVVDRVARQHGGNYFALSKVSPIAFLVGVLSGWLTYYVYGWGLGIAGRWLGGTADTAKAQTVLAWALTPVVTGLGLVTLVVAIFSNDYFAIPPDNSLNIALLIAQGICSAWALVILSKGLQLIQGFGPGRALVNILIPGAFLICVIILIAWFF